LLHSSVDVYVPSRIAA
jgi:hypothetical protein